MGNICSPLCSCSQCCACGQDQLRKTITIQKQPLVQQKKSVKKVHFHQKQQDVYDVVTVQDYGQGPHPSIAKYSQMPKLTRQQIQVLQRQRPLQTQKDRTGTPYPCFFLLNKRIWYQGEWRKGLPYGKGKAYFQSSGMYYQGYFNDGFAQSIDGIAVFPQGSYYRGNVSNSKLIGKGTYFNAHKNLTYRGQWNNDKPEGYGFEQFLGSSTYQGQFKDGYKSGKGKITWKNGMVYEGDFHLGYMWGNGRLTKGRGVYEGIFERGVKVGQNVTMITDTGVYRGPLVQGQMWGDGQFTWQDRKKYSGQFQNGNLHGTGNMIYPNGQMVTGVWQEGMNEGVQRISQK